MSIGGEGAGRREGGKEKRVRNGGKRKGGEESYGGRQGVVEVEVTLLL